ncbi:MAG TPA: hypothetical protein VG796_25510 [Verrucomicrobiales bacterium]|jgi:hypothetical protein|nr:hypothetical protein [Verrucomicrobiales bacterium]
MNKSSIMHDLKPERPDLSPPLPAFLMVLPVLFYLSCVGAVGLGALFTLKTNQAQKDEQRELDSEQDVKRQIMALKQEQKIIDDTHAKAREVEAWMHSTEPLMDVVCAVINSVKKTHTLSSLRLSRTADKPEHIEMRIEINNGGNQQKEDTVQALVKQGYQTFRDDLIAPNKNDKDGAVTYTATLVKAASSEE